MKEYQDDFNAGGSSQSKHESESKAFHVPIEKPTISLRNEGNIPKGGSVVR